MAIGFIRWLPIALSLTCFLSVEVDQAVAQQTPTNSPEDQVRAMHWVRTGTMKLTASSSSITVPPGFFGVSGDEARKVEELSEGESEANVEGVLLDHSHDTVIFEFFPSGFVPIDDWQDLDSQRLITAISQNAETSNELRRQKGIAELHVTGWVQEPSLDRATNTVFWATGITTGAGRDLVNSLALRLGRSGFEKIIWVTDRDAYKASGGVLDTMLRAYSFDPGQRFDDHVEGDRLAGYGVAALVGAVAGAKLAKIGAFAAILLFAKKLWFLALAVPLIFFRKIKSLFASGPQAPTS